jgi:transposase
MLAWMVQIPSPRSYREIRRSLKRYIVRSLYRQLNTLYAAAEPAPSDAAGVGSG